MSFQISYFFEFDEFAKFFYCNLRFLPKDDVKEKLEGWRINLICPDNKN